jgi:hypothetical protein
LVRRGPQPSKEEIIEGVGASLKRRFSKRPPKDIREITGALNKALGAIFLRKLGFSGELNSFDRCLRWSRDLYLANDGRHVFGVPGWLAWPAASIRREGEGWRFERRGVAQHKQEVKGALVDSYRRIAEARRTGAVQIPLLPIYEVRETAAFQCRVCDEVVDRVLGDLAFRKESSGDVVIQLQIADAREFAPSARPFLYEEKRYFYVTMHESRAPRAPDAGKGHGD